MEWLPYEGGWYCDIPAGSWSVLRAKVRPVKRGWEWCVLGLMTLAIDVEPTPEDAKAAAFSYIRHSVIPNLVRAFR